MHAARAMIIVLALCGLVYNADARADWTVVLPEALAEDEAVTVVLADLKDAAQARGIAIEPAGEPGRATGNVIFVGSPERNASVRRMQARGALALSGVTKPDGYEIVTMPGDGGRTMVVAGGSVLGDVYGLYWLWDRLRVQGGIPDINVRHEPSLDTRFTRIVVRSEEDIRRALRYRLNMVFGETPLRLVPWDAEPERTENEGHRARTRELAAYAHAVHLKFVAFGTDFTYHPSLLAEFGATLNPADPAFWAAVQTKYRRLFEAMPELDGVCTFTADEQQYWGSYRTFDVMHDGEGCDWGLDKRCRTFIVKLWEVVAGEFDKLLLYHTWDNTPYEKQSQAGVYQSIFTDEVPTRNLYLFPSFTQNDRWWFQAYNPTINQTPHHTMLICEPMDYHAGGNLFPTFPGPYFQAGLETMLDVENSNLKGLSLDMPSDDAWHTRGLTAYTVSRLAWNHHATPREIARDYAAIHFGLPAADGVAELLLLSPVAYAYGLYIEPAAYGEFNSLPHIRVGQFVANGYTSIDGGKEHIEFLRKIYLRCKPWIPETVLYLDHGLATAGKMVGQYEAVRALIADVSLNADLGESIHLTHLLIRTNNAYVKTAFAYFEGRENLTEENRRRLETECSGLRAARNEFANAPGFDYQLFGVDQLLVNVEQTLQDPQRAARILAEAPTRAEIEEVVAREQERYSELLEQHGAEAVKILHWRGKIDGEDIVRIRGAEVSVEHLRWDGPTIERSEVLEPLPATAGTVVVKDIQSRALHPFVLEQSCAGNGHVAVIYLNDLPGGGDWWEFELYYIPHPPGDLGLRVSLRNDF